MKFSWEIADENMFWDVHLKTVVWSFLQKYLLSAYYVARHCSQHWEYNSEKRKDKDFAYVKAYIIVVETENKQTNKWKKIA